MIVKETIMGYKPRDHPLEQRIFQSTRSIAISVVKPSSGTACVGWGDADKTRVVAS